MAKQFCDSPNDWTYFGMAKSTVTNSSIDLSSIPSNAKELLIEMSMIIAGSFGDNDVLSGQYNIVPKDYFINNLKEITYSVTSGSTDYTHCIFSNSGGLSQFATSNSIIQGIRVKVWYR